MNLREALGMAATGLAGHKLRAALAMLGIVIGVAAVIALIHVGQNAGNSVRSQLRGLGANLIVLTPLRGASFSLEDVRELEERVPSLAAVAPVTSLGSVVAGRGATTHETTVQGTTADFAAVRDREVAAGRFLTARDAAERAPVAVLGETAAEALFQDRPPLGEAIEIDGRPFTVVGLLAPKGSSFGQDQDDLILIPITVALRMSDGRVHLIYARAREEAQAPLAVNHVTAIYERKWGRPGSDLPLRVTSQDELLQTIENASRTLSLMLGAIAAISLVVGGIGIMNIMLVAVAERTREIGILQAIGARRRDILLQFLLESSLLSLGGGVLGVLLGAAASLAAGRFLGVAGLPSPLAAMGVFAFAGLVGLVSGLYPAWKAARLDPLEALRHL